MEQGLNESLSYRKLYEIVYKTKKVYAKLLIIKGYPLTQKLEDKRAFDINYSKIFFLP